MIDVRDSLGADQAIEPTWPDGRIRRLALYGSLPFVCVQGSIRNPGGEPVTLDQITPLVARVDAGAAAGDLRGFGPEGLYDLGTKTNFCFAAAADPQTRAGVVCGWLRHYRGSGVVTVAGDGDSVVFEGRSEYGRLLVPPGDAGALAGAIERMINDDKLRRKLTDAAREKVGREFDPNANAATLINAMEWKS